MSTETTAKYDHAAFPGSPLEQGRAREAALAEGVYRLGFKYGVTFKGPIHIRGLRGEMDLFLKDGQRYGEELAKLIAKHNPRMGSISTKHMDPLNSWCLMNHFDVARMLEEAGV